MKEKEKYLIRIYKKEIELDEIASLKKNLK